MSLLRLMNPLEREFFAKRLLNEKKLTKSQYNSLFEINPKNKKPEAWKLKI